MQINKRKIGQRIRSARMMNNLTQENLGNMLGISPQAVQKIESGENMVNVEYLVIISEKLNVSLDYIVNGKVKSDTDFEMSFEAMSSESKFYLLIRLLMYFSKLDNPRYREEIQKILDAFKYEE